MLMGDDMSSTVANPNKARAGQAATPNCNTTNDMLARITGSLSLIGKDLRS